MPKCNFTIKLYRNEEQTSVKVEGIQPTEKQQPVVSSREKFDEIEQEVLDTVPKTTKSRARLILNKIKSNKDIMHWNERGELIYDGKAVPSTHVVDLIRDIVKGRKSFDPYGWQYFARGLAKMNTPHDWIGNDQRKEVMQQYKNKVDQGEDGEEDIESVRFLPSPPMKTPRAQLTRRALGAPPLNRRSWQKL